MKPHYRRMTRPVSIGLVLTRLMKSMSQPSNKDGDEEFDCLSNRERLKDLGINRNRVQEERKKMDEEAGITADCPLH